MTEELTYVLDSMEKLIANTRDDQMANPTPCVQWTVRDLINHVTGGSTMFALSAELGAVPDDVMGQLMGGDNLGDDFRGAFKVATQRALAAFDEPGVLEKIVKLPFGEMPAGIALRIAVFDVATHAADIAHATGQPVADQAVYEQALAIGREMIGPDWRRPGVFGEEQSCDDAAPANERILAFAGRKL